MSHDDPNTSDPRGSRPEGSRDGRDDTTGPVPPAGGSHDTSPIPTSGQDDATGAFGPPSPRQQPYQGPQGQPHGAPQYPGAPVYSTWQQPGQPPQQGHGRPVGGPGQPNRPGQQPYAAASQGSYPPPPGGQQPTRRRSRAPWVAVPVAAILAAVLASGGTYAMTHNNATGAGAGGTSTTIVKANPADFGNAGQVNWSATASKVTPSVVSITAVKGQNGDQGSGVVLDTAGNIVTNNHVVAVVGKGGTVTVTLSNNNSYQAKVIGTDPSTDLAVIRLENPPKGLTPITMGDDSKLVVGQPVMAIGNPLGLAGTVTTGIVSSLNRPVTTQEETNPGSGGSGTNPFGLQQQQQAQQTVTTNAIQTSAAINPGNSGGALVSGSGQLIGINSSIATVGQSSASSQSGNIGIGFAIPVSVVKNITGQLIKDGKATHAQVGVTVQTATVKVNGATEQAAKVVTVKKGSSAAKAGLKAGDVITAVDGKSVVSSDALVGYVRAKTVGQKIKLTVIRGGQQQSVTVTLGADTSSS
ncbi:trypsin-like peptidase domain-containing protein [Leekyejoonella antrihumi]|uniref:PDZ domain-containing protein n=1 Tax=Leekyejoonella antrihumi TaxID=1660198 RepID=A0A563DYX3_9MICO|nr:trypsin-like peptidase domain-containing protein [Leekyejoonella antrihumi]TWP35460.1 PDZ domain-containing protein [Leekyejoonella antrihumi]